MGRIPCCEKENVKRGQWTPEEDQKLSSYIAQNGTRNWRLIPKHAGLPRSNIFLDSDVFRISLPHQAGLFIDYIMNFQVFRDVERAVDCDGPTTSVLVLNRWSVIAAQLQGRTDNDVKNHWNTKLKKKLSGMGIDPVTHKPFSHLITEIATLPPPQAPNLAEAALGCFKDEMLHLLTKRRIDLQMQQCGTAPPNHNICIKPEDNKDDTIEKIKFGLSKAIKEPDLFPINMPWDPVGATSVNLDRSFHTYTGSDSGFHYELASLGNNGDVSPWSQSLCTGSTCAGGDQHGHLHENLENEQGENSGTRKETRIGSSIFNSDCSLWDLSSDDLINPII